MAKILIACEFSGIVREAFKAKGHDAWSCDLLDTEILGQHIKGDVIEILNDGWDLMIAHPPCTYLCNGSMNWLYREKGRYENMLLAVKFIKELYYSSIPKVAIENPIGILSTQFQKPNQIIKPNYFGSEYRKDIALWLKNLPLLKWFNQDDLFNKKTSNERGDKKLDFWSTNRVTPEGYNKKSIFFPEVAKAMAEQWG